MQNPLRRAKTYELIAERLEGQIRNGELPSGSTLPTERELMEQFGVGRPAVREALFSLARKGLVTSSSGRRTIVKDPSISDVFNEVDSVVQHLLRKEQTLEDLFQARIFLETAVARHAAEHMTLDQTVELRAALKANTLAIGDREAFVQSDIAFHRLLFKSLRNPVFDAVNDALVIWLMNRWLELDRSDESERTANDGHQSIYAAIAARDPDAAASAMRNHLARSWVMWRQQLLT